jgi:dolichyl-phosphate-mannose--protein O-mannosyl transferase
MKKPGVWLRIAAVLTLIHAVLHTVGGVFGSVDPGPAAVAVQAMKVNQFLLLGHVRSYWDFYRGMGLGVTIFLTAEGIIFWQLASLSQKEVWRLRPVLMTFAIAYLAFSINSYRYFFIAPVIFEILIAACLVGAIVTARSGSEAHAGAEL